MQFHNTRVGGNFISGKKSKGGEGVPQRCAAGAVGTDVPGGPHTYVKALSAEHQSILPLFLFEKG